MTASTTRLRWPLERVLFALAGTMTLLSAAARRDRQPLVPAADRVRRHQPVALRHRRRVPRLDRARPPARPPIVQVDGHLASLATGRRGGATSRG